MPARPAEGSFYWTFADRVNEVELDPVRTSALRLELQLQPERSAGLFELEIVDVP